jgi:hypothetical protein
MKNNSLNFKVQTIETKNIYYHVPSKGMYHIIFKIANMWPSDPMPFEKYIIDCKEYSKEDFEKKIRKIKIQRILE